MTDELRVAVQVMLHPHIARQLQEACTDAEALGSYLDNVILQRTHTWQRGLRDLEEAGWLLRDLQRAFDAVHEALLLEFGDAPVLVRELRDAGLKRLSRRLARRPALAQALLHVLLELRAGNQACARAVKRMRAVRPSWWRRLAH